MYKSMLVATDGSETAAEAVRVATELARTFGATLHIANVYRTDAGAALSVPGMTLGLPEGINRGSMAATDVESAASYARSKGVKAETHAVTGDVAERIVGIAEEEQVDLVVVGNKGMRGIRRVLGSVPNAVAHTASCSVLIVNTT
jgi:nucleotide-binding universal stress UspA family protein